MATSLNSKPNCLAGVYTQMPRNTGCSTPGIFPRRSESPESLVTHSVSRKINLGLMALNDDRIKAFHAGLP